MAFVKPLALILLLSAFASAQEPAALRFKAGETLKYKVEQNTKISDTSIEAEGKKPETVEMQTKMKLVKVWTVKEVAKDGSAALELTVVSMRLERTDAKGTTVFDSDKPDGDNDKEFRKFIGQPLATVTVGADGQVKDVKNVVNGSADRYRNEPPFRLVFDGKPLAADAKWERPFEITVPPPAGVNDKYKAVQKFSLVEDGKKQVRAVGLRTEIENLPAGIEAVPLLNHLAEGNLYYAPDLGRYVGCRLRIGRTLDKYQGEGTRYVYESVLNEDLLP